MTIRTKKVCYIPRSKLRDFQATHEVPQGAASNHHEPAFDVDGDGLGVFGSAVVDMVYLEVLRP